MESAANANEELAVFELMLFLPATLIPPMSRKKTITRTNASFTANVKAMSAVSSLDDQTDMDRGREGLAPANNLVVAGECADNSVARFNGVEVLRMAAKKAKKTGAGVVVHPGRKALRLHGSIAREIGQLIVS